MILQRRIDISKMRIPSFYLVWLHSNGPYITLIERFGHFRIPFVRAYERADSVIFDVENKDYKKYFSIDIETEGGEHLLGDLKPNYNFEKSTKCGLK